MLKVHLSTILFIHFFDQQTRQIVVLTPDANPSTMDLLYTSLTQAISQVFMGKLSLPRLESWSTYAYSPYEQTFHEYKGDIADDIDIPGIVYLGIAKISSSMASRSKEIDKVLDFTHASTALTLIGCSPSIERT